MLSLIAVRAAELEIPHVAVYGTAVIEAVPDEMHWMLSVSTQGAEVAAVAKTHDEKVAGVIAFLKDRSIDKDKIQTSQITLAENWVYRDGNRNKDGYIASTTVVFESGKLEQYRDLWIGLANLADVSVNSVGFDTSKRIEHQNKARLMAVRAAKDKAIALAEALGSRVDAPLAIEEDMPMNDVYQSRGAKMGAFAGIQDAARNPGDSSISAGTISIEARVKLIFRITPE